MMWDTLNAKILRVLYEKAQQIREDYGFSPPFFGDDVDVISLIGDMGLAVDLPPAQCTIFDSFADDADKKNARSIRMGKRLLRRSEMRVSTGRLRSILRPVWPRVTN